MTEEKNSLIRQRLLGLGGLFGALALFAARTAQAVCPVCVVAIAGGLGLSEYLGIDDTIAGSWIGGLTVAMIIWTLSWLDKKDWGWLSAKPHSGKSSRDLTIAAAYYAMVIWPLAAKHLIGHPGNRLFGTDKLLLGIIAGSLVFLAAVADYDRLKRKNGGHAWFPYQKVAWPFGSLVLLSLAFYILISL